MTTLCGEIGNAFIEEFAPLYYKPDNTNPNVLSETEYDRRCNDWGLLSLNSVDFDAEMRVMEFLKSGDYGENALAWKAGKVKWDSANSDLIFYKGFKKGNGYSIGQRGKIVSKESFESYCKLLHDKKDEINLLVSRENYSGAYKKALYIFDENENKKVSPSPQNLGPVNIFNALFFISKEKMPIYDAFAHIAVRALALDIFPEEVFLGSNPDKKDVSGVTRMFGEYILLLKRVFPQHVNADGSKAFIPRDLDRALWVYGHAEKKYCTYQKVIRND